MAYYPPKPDQQPTRHPRSSRYNSQPQAQQQPQQPYQQPYGNQYPQAQPQYPQQQYGGQYPQYPQQYPQDQGQWQPQQYQQTYQQPYAGQYPQQQAAHVQQNAEAPAKGTRKSFANLNVKIVALSCGCIAIIALVIVIFSVVLGGGPKYTTLRAPEMTTFARLFPVIASLPGAEGMDTPVYFAAVQVDKDMSNDDLIKIYQKRLGSQAGRNQALYIYKDKAYYDKGYFMPDYAIVSNGEGAVACQRITPDMLASLAMMEALGGGSMEGFADFANAINDLSESVNGIE